MSLPTQVSPPEFALTDRAPSRVLGVAVVAVPVLRGEDGPTLGPGSAELADDLGIDLLSVLENAGATGATGEVTELPVARSADPDVAPVNPDLVTVLLVGVGDATLTDVRRAAATLARHTLNTESVASSVAAVGDELRYRPLAFDRDSRWQGRCRHGSHARLRVFDRGRLSATTDRPAMPKPWSARCPQAIVQGHLEALVKYLSCM